MLKRTFDIFTNSFSLVDIGKLYLTVCDAILDNLFLLNITMSKKIIKMSLATSFCKRYESLIRLVIKTKKR